MANAIDALFQSRKSKVESRIREYVPEQPVATDDCFVIDAIYERDTTFELETSIAIEGWSIRQRRPSRMRRDGPWVHPRFNMKPTSGPKQGRQRKDSAPVMHAFIANGGAAPMRIQFAREEIYAIARVKRPTDKSTGQARDPKASAADVIGEAIRDAPQHYRHLTAQGLTPLPARCLFGVAPEGLQDWFKGHCELAPENLSPQRLNGKVYMRKQSPQVPSLLSTVASFPGPANDEDFGYCSWRTAVTAWAREHYGGDLISVLEHVDEPHGHIHVLVARPDASPVRGLQSGWAERDAAIERGIDPSELGEAYRQGCRRFQDRFFDAVGRPCGLARLSPQPHGRHSYQEARVREQLGEEVEVVEASLKLARSDWEYRQSRQEADLLVRIDALVAREAAADSALAQAMRRAAAVAHERAQLERIRAETSRLAAAAEAKMAEAVEAYQAAGHVVAALQQAAALRETFEAYVREVNPDPAVARRELARLGLSAEGRQRRL